MDLYNELLREGIKEQAGFVLPLATPTVSICSWWPVLGYIILTSVLDTEHKRNIWILQMLVRKF